MEVSSARGVRVEHDDGQESNGSVDDQGLLKVLFVSNFKTHTGRMVKTDIIKWSNGSTTFKLPSRRHKHCEECRWVREEKNTVRSVDHMNAKGHHYG